MTTFALVDVNNFYASCQRVFEPRLEGCPVVVLSNNDGCIVARSSEAKLLDIPMGAPYFKYRDFCTAHQVKVFSSNYALYNDMSQRVMAILHQSCPDMEVYSIDEAFLCLDNFACGDLVAYCKGIRHKILQWTGLPVSIGIGKSKTLAKVANYFAKQHTKTGIYDLRDSTLQAELLPQLPTQEIWGIGRQLTSKLAILGINTAEQLRNAPIKQLRKNFGVTLERIILELRGISCLPLEVVQPRKNIMASRSFGKPVREFSELESAVSCHVATACQKLRAQHSRAQGIYVFVKSSPFNTVQPFYQKGLQAAFIEPTNDTGLAIKTAKLCLNRIYSPQYCYQKAGILLMDLISENIRQGDLWLDQAVSLRKEKLMHALDGINQKMGRNTVFMAAQGMPVQRTWQMRADLKSPAYTTDWQQILQIRT
ncbi:MAG: Y-family DNA polymerase [Gammaproteobacteria bacterium]